MILFVGLGNPGEKYAKTPHNAGFMVMDRLRNFLGYSPTYNVGDWEFDKYSDSFVSVGKADGEIRFVLAKPNTFMNKSGLAVKQLVKKFKVQPESDLVLFYDDLDIKLGESKITKGKYPKGHKGLVSIFSMIKEFNFLSVRLGIDNREGKDIPGEDYVLKEYSKEELEILDQVISETIKKVRVNLTI